MQYCRRKWYVGVRQRYYGYRFDFLHHFEGGAFTHCDDCHDSEAATPSDYSKISKLRSPGVLNHFGKGYQTLTNGELFTDPRHVTANRTAIQALIMGLIR